MEKEDIKKKVANQFGKNADKYATSESHAKGEGLRLLVEWLQPKDHWVALDIATAADMWPKPCHLT